MNDLELLDLLDLLENADFIHNHYARKANQLKNELAKKLGVELKKPLPLKNKK